jgi:hypothetical protein
MFKNIKEIDKEQIILFLGDNLEYLFLSLITIIFILGLNNPISFEPFNVLEYTK